MQNNVLAVKIKQNPLKKTRKEIGNVPPFNLVKMMGNIVDAANWNNKKQIQFNSFFDKIQSIYSRKFGVKKLPAIKPKTKNIAKEQRVFFSKIKLFRLSNNVFKIIGQDLLSLASSCAVCLVMILFWISYVVFKRKYYA